MVFLWTDLSIFEVGPALIYSQMDAQVFRAKMKIIMMIIIIIMKIRACSTKPKVLNPNTLNNLFFCVIYFTKQLRNIGIKTSPSLNEMYIW